MQLLSFDNLPQTHQPTAAKATAYVTAAITQGDEPFIRNVRTELRGFAVGEHLLPVTINDATVPENSYVVSPLTAYSGYAEAELPKLQRPWMERPLRNLIRSLGRYLERQKIDRIVQVNNWMLSTNLYPPDWSGSELEEITSHLVAEFPDHVIGFRSLNRVSNAELIERLKSLGYWLVPSRQVYLFDARQGADSEFFAHHNTQIDQVHLRKTHYRRIEHAQICAADFPRLEQLYNMLYLDKYCRLNPQYTARWLACGHRDGWLKLAALRDPEGRIDGVVGWFATSDVLTAPIVGYDTSLPQKTGLYRLLTAMCLREATERRVLLNFSAGASHFKRMRGGVPCIEYSAIYVRHLSATRRRAWRITRGVLQGVGVPIMKALKL